MTLPGIGTYTFAWSIGVPGYPPPQSPMTHTDFVQRSSELGAKVVQFADNLPLHTLSPDALDTLQAETERLGLAVEVGTRGIAPPHLRDYLQLAVRFGSPIVRVVVDTADHHPDPPEIIATVRDILPEFEAAGINLAIENHDRFKAKTLAEILNTLDSEHVGICLDTVNSFGALEGPAAVLETLGPYVVNLHVKDFSIQRLDHNMGFSLTGTPAGQGMLDLPWLMDQLQGRTYNAILELWPPLQASVEATIQLEQDWAVQSMPFLIRAVTGV